MKKLVAATVSACVVLMSLGEAHSGERLFTVHDDLQLTSFIKPFVGNTTATVVEFSPDGRYFAAVTETCIESDNSVEDVLWVFPVERVRQALRDRSPTQTPDLGIRLSAVRSRTTSISNLRWLDDSGGLAFLAQNATGDHELRVAEIATRKTRVLSIEGQEVTGFDIRHNRVVYSALAPSVEAAIVATNLRNTAAVVVGTGRGLDGFIFPPDPKERGLYTLSELWTATDGAPVRLEDAVSHQPLHIHKPYTLYSDEGFWLDPSGKSLLARWSVPDVPREWTTYPPAAGPGARKIKAGPQNVNAPALREGVEEFVTIDIASGQVTALTNAPIGTQDGYFGSLDVAAWSADGAAVLLANTFLPLEAKKPGERTGEELTPCVAVVELRKMTASCVLRFPQDPTVLRKAGIHRVTSVRFLGTTNRKVVIDVMPEVGGRALHEEVRSTVYVRGPDGVWRSEGPYTAPAGRDGRIEVVARQSLNEPPALVATDRATGVSKVLLAPNAYMDAINLGTATTLRWKDKNGDDWVGGLVKPPHFVAGGKYPLVLQTHGFEEGQFLASGAFTTAMAARELAAAGIVVLQIGAPNNGYDTMLTPSEGLQQVASYESAIDKLAAEGVIDPQKVGLIGFSRTVYAVLEALTTSHVRFGAATIADGIQFGYLEYMMQADSNNNGVAREADAITGAAPFGDGLTTWVKRSPQFNMDKVDTPVRVEAYSPRSLLFMWGPYAALRYLKKPVDLIMINGGEHVQTNPAARLASQGGAVDWFRFWLQGYEDPDPTKADQYARWRNLREMRNQRIAASSPSGGTAE